MKVGHQWRESSVAMMDAHTHLQLNQTSYQHIKAAHLRLKKFARSFLGCHMKFVFKHVRDKHEKSRCHIYTPGNFGEADEQFRNRPTRGGRKRKYPFIETLFRKRVVPLCESDVADWTHRSFVVKPGRALILMHYEIVCLYVANC